MDGFPELTIGEVARRAGVATSSIRYYERIGLLPKPDRSGGPAALRRGCAGQAGVHRRRPERRLQAPRDQGADRRRDGADGLGEPMRSLSSRKLGEVEALLERTKAMKGWLEVAQECGCATPAECALFPAPGEEPPGADLALRCRPGGRQGLSPAARGLNLPTVASTRCQRCGVSRAHQLPTSCERLPRAMGDEVRSRPNRSSTWRAAAALIRETRCP